MELNKNELYEIHAQNNEDFYAGYFLAQDDDYILINDINTDGLDSGFLLINKGIINHIEYKTQYCAKMEKLIKYHNATARKNIFKTENLLQQVLQYAKDNQSIVSVELLDSKTTDVFGFIENFDEECFYMNEIDNYGYLDGKSISNIEDISSMSLDESCNLRYKILYKMNY